MVSMGWATSTGRPSALFHPLTISSPVSNVLHRQWIQMLDLLPLGANVGDLRNRKFRHRRPGDSDRVSGKRLRVSNPMGIVGSIPPRDAAHQVPRPDDFKLGRAAHVDTNADH